MKNFIHILLFLFLGQAVHAQYPTRGEIYDFQVGDEFHYRVNPGSQYVSAINRKFVLERFDFPDQDSVSYTIRFERYSATFPPDNSGPINEIYEDDTLTYGINNLSVELIPPKCNDTLPPGACFAEDTLLLNNFCDRDVTFFSIIEGVPYFEYDRNEWKYAPGLGQFYKWYGSDSGGNYQEETSMIYYKKGDDVCGTPNYIISNVESNSIYRDISIFPNPSTGVIQLDISDNEIDLLQVYDITGKQVYVKKSPSILLDLTILDSGVYFITVKGKNFQGVTKFNKI